MKKDRPYLLFGAIFFGAAAGSFIPLEIQSFFLGVSLFMKSLILFLLPFIIFSLLFKAAQQLSKSGSGLMIGLILLLIITSNFISTLISGFSGFLLYNLDHALLLPKEGKELVPLFSLALTKLIDNDKAMMAGLFCGLISNYIPFLRSDTLLRSVDRFSELALKGISKMIPFFIFGFVLKLSHDGVISTILKDYTLIFAAVATLQFSYLSIVYLLLHQGRLNKTLDTVRNLLPAALSGLCTMSSAASMPLTLAAAEKNCQNKDLAKSVIPATVNTHLVGDCFAIPIFAFCILKSFDFPAPGLFEYLTFVLYFVLAKFSVAAIPGGGILVMLPVLEAHLGFQGEMMSLITALYVLFDPVITAVNILCNGAMVKLVDILSLQFARKPT
jgi:Na+/H+-dicarboxylate symporter